MMNRLSLTFSTKGLQQCTYDLILGSFWDDLRGLLTYASFDKVVLIVDAAVSRNVGDRLDRFAAEIGNCSILTVLSGEGAKTAAYAEDVITQLASLGATEYSLIVCVGGGSVGNLITFVAATYLRGIRYIFVPTTLMAMADSAVGHKGALNIHKLKNLCGLFYPPEFIFIDFRFLDWLPATEMRSGFAEIIKHAVIEDNGLLEQLRAVRFNPIGLTLNVIHSIVCETIASHMRLAANDLRENESGALLQCGHIVGHAIELLCPELRHGEAIAIGLVEEATLATSVGIPVKRDLPSRLSGMLKAAGLPTDIPRRVGAKALLGQLQRSKHRSLEGLVRFVFLEDLCRPHIENGSYWRAVTYEALKMHFASEGTGYKSATPAVKRSGEMDIEV